MDQGIANALAALVFMAIIAIPLFIAGAYLAYWQYVGRYKQIGRAFREGWEEYDGDED